MPNDTLFQHTTEEAFLAILLANEDRVLDSMDKVTPEMFSAKMYGIVYNAILILEREQIVPTPMTVKLYLEKKKLLDEIGGAEFIDRLATTSVDASGFTLFMQNIIDSYRGKLLLQLAQQIPQLVHNTSDMMSVLGTVSGLVRNIEGETAGNGIISIKQLLEVAWEAFEERVEKPGITGVTTGFPTLDFMTGGFIAGQEWIFSSRPSMGKTTTLLESFKEAAKQDVPCLLFSREMSSDELMIRLMSMESGVPYHNIKNGTVTESEKKKAKTALRRLSKLPIYLDANYYGDINYVVSAIRKYHKHHNIRLVGLDYIQLLTTRTSDQVTELGRISRELKLLSMDLGLTTVTLSQLNRRAEDREDRRPMLADLRASGNLEEDADVVVGLYRDEMYNLNSPKAGKIEFLILKQRNGPLGIVEFGFNGECLHIEDSATDLDFGKEQ